MMLNPIRNLGSIRSYLDSKGQVQEKLVTGLGPSCSFSDQLQSCMKEVIEESRVKSQMCEESGNWFPNDIILPTDGHSSYQYIMGTFETTLNNIKAINLPQSPHEVTNFRNAYQEILITATPKINSNIKADLMNKQNKIVIISLGIKFKYKVPKNMYTKALIKFINSTLILNEDINTDIVRKFKIKDDDDKKKTKNIYGYFSSIDPSQEVKDTLQQVFPQSNITITNDGSTTMKSYGFTKLNISGGYADCSNLGLLLGANVDNVIYRAKPFTYLAAGFELRKQQAEIFTKLLKLKINDESSPTDPKWLSTHDIYHWCDSVAEELVSDWIKEPYQLNGPDPLIFELFKCNSEQQLTKKLLSQSDMGNKSIISQVLSRVSKMKIIPNPSPVAKLSSFINNISEDTLINEIQFIHSADLTLEYSWSLARVFFWCSKYLFRDTYQDKSNVQNCSNNNTLLLMGPPCTGKSTVLTILKDMLDGMIVNRSTYQRPSIIFSSAIIYPEFNTAALAQWPDIYKAKLEGAMQCVDVKYKDPLNILKNIPCIGDTNSELPLKDLKIIDAEAFNRRIYCVRFTYKFGLDNIPQFTYNEFVKTMIGFYATFPDQRQGIFNINFSDYGIDEKLIQAIGEQFKQTQWYSYFWKTSSYHHYLSGQYHKTETSVLVDDEIKGSQTHPFPIQYREFTLKNPDVYKMFAKEHGSKEDIKEDESIMSGFQSGYDEIELINALELPECKSKEQLCEKEAELDRIFTFEYYDVLVKSFLQHCGSMKNKAQLEKEVLDYFKNMHKDQLPETEDEANDIFSDEVYRREVLNEIKEFSFTDNSSSPSQNKRNIKEQEKSQQKNDKIERVNSLYKGPNETKKNDEQKGKGNKKSKN